MMKTVKITSAFTGYPNGKDSRDYLIGEELEVSNDFADNIVGKGLATEVSTTTKAAPAEKKDATE